MEAVGLLMPLAGIGILCTGKRNEAGEEEVERIERICTTLAKAPPQGR